MKGGAAMESEMETDPFVDAAAASPASGRRRAEEAPALPADDVAMLGVPTATRLLSAKRLLGTGARAREPVSSSLHSAYDTMRKWNVSFSGDGDEDAEEFLTCIREGRALLSATDAELLRCIPFFLTGTARVWFRVRHTRWNTWRDFEEAWRRRFGAPNFQVALREEAMRRTQGECERVADYLTLIQAIWGR